MDGGLVLGHARLSIIDLSEAGTQPMTSHDGRWTIVYNGEIYNHLELRRELEQERELHLHGHSDTEVVLEAFATWGVERTLRKLDGMFAIALWDKTEETLYLIRDRVGEKPLYYGWVDEDTLFFASELKVLRALGVRLPISSDGLASYFLGGYVIQPLSIFESVYSVRPGSYLVFRSPEKPQGFDPFSHPIRYWRIEDEILRYQFSPFSGTLEDAKEEFLFLLERSVTRRLLSDVPLGAFLSGGIDSSLVVALMQRNASKTVQTYTIGFSEKEFDESTYARAVADHLGTDHHEELLSWSSVLDRLESILEIWDEPFADASQLPTHMVARMARKYITVALTGDAGDEFSGGYGRYYFFPNLLKELMHPSLWTRGKEVVSRLFHHLYLPLVVSLMERLDHPLLKRLHHKGDLFSYAYDSREFRRKYVGFEGKMERPFPYEGSYDFLEKLLPWPEGLDPVPLFQMWDVLAYLPSDIFVKVDRASMAVNLETRTPFLAPEVMEFLLSIPLDWRVRRRDEYKWFLREVAYSVLPRAILDRPKHGFRVPLKRWLVGELREMVEELLSPSTLEDAGLRPEPIRRAWEIHKKGFSDRYYAIWMVVAYLQWRKAYSDLIA